MSKNLKRYLMLLAAIGLLAVGTGGSGTFATFNAEVANNGNYFATGTLFLHTTKSGGSTCKSEVDSGNSNITSNGCDFLFHVSNLGANQTQSVNLQLDNAGSLDASKLEFALGSSGCDDSTPPTITTLTASASGTPGTLTVATLPQTLVSGTQIRLTQGLNQDVLTVSSTSTGTMINVSGTLTNSYTSGAIVQLVTNFGSSNLCSNLQFSIQELDSLNGTAQKCVFPANIVGATCTSTSSISGITTSLNDLTSDLWTLGSNGSTALLAGDTRFLKITIASGSFPSNAQQNAQANFDLVWRIEQ